MAHPPRSEPALFRALARAPSHPACLLASLLATLLAALLTLAEAATGPLRAALPGDRTGVARAPHPAILVLRPPPEARP